MSDDEIDGDEFFDDEPESGEDGDDFGNISDVLAAIQTLMPSSMGGSSGRQAPQSTPADLMIPPAIQEWLMGGGKTPQSIRSLGNEVTAKMTWTIALILVQQFSRVPRLMHFVNAAEATLYQDVDLASLETAEIKERYKGARTTMTEALEFIRKFSIQNREALSSLGGAAEDEAVLLQLLRSAPVEKLQKIKKILQEESGDVSRG